MSFYGMMFGQNPVSDILLATLGLTKNDVGRFRDCHLDDGKIAVYTRNGGGNRCCWHEDDPELGSPGCKHHEIQVEEDELQEVRDGCLVTYKKTGLRVIKTRHVCEEPDSAECACPGCTIQYRLRQHPDYVTDRDDDFDCTYATIFFRYPEEYADGLRKLETSEKWDPDARWLELIDRVEAGHSSAETTGGCE